MQKLLLSFFLLLSVFITQPAFAENKAVVLDISGVLTPATQDYLERGMRYAAAQKAEIIILQLNTPSGLETVTRHINEAILSSAIPIVVYVAPAGAQAIGAGTFLLFASHLAAMAPSTNLGAAAPANIGNANPGTLKGKLTNTLQAQASNDSATYLRSLAELRKRNADWAETAVRQAATVSNNEAMQLHVIEIQASDLSDLLKKLNNRTVTLHKSQQTLHTANIDIEKLQPDWHYRFLAIVTNPNIAYILLLVGIYALFVEFIYPGLVVPGVLGSAALLIALFAFNLLPTNYAGLSLLLMGMVFIVSEVFITSYGLLGIGGLAAFAFGSTLLFDANSPGYHITWQVILIMSIVSISFFLLVLFLWKRTPNLSS